MNVRDILLQYKEIMKYKVQINQECKIHSKNQYSSISIKKDITECTANLCFNKKINSKNQNYMSKLSTNTKKL